MNKAKSQVLTKDLQVMSNAELVMTVEEMQDEAAWLKVRNSGLGGSDAAVIAGMNQWKSPLTLWLEKTGKQAPKDLSGNERIYWGKKNEGNIAEWFEETTGKKVMRRGLMRSVEYPYMLATVDRMVVGEKAGLEIKTAGVDQSKKWLEGEMPDNYYLQVQWYLAVTGYDKWYVAVLIGGNQAKYMVVERNENEITKLIELAKEFWHKVENGIMPEIDGTEDCGDTLQKLHPTSNGMAIPLPSGTQKVIEDIKLYKDMAKDIKGEQTKLENVLKAALGDNETGTVGDYKVTWKNQAGRVSIDAKGLRADYPDIYRDYSSQGQSSRVLRIS